LQSGDTGLDNDGDGNPDGSDFWAVDLVAGASYTFTLCDAGCPGAGADFDTRMRAFDPLCNLIVQEDDTCGFFEEITLTATETGTHVIEVTSFFAGDAGTYTLGWREGGLAPSCMNTNGQLPDALTACQTLDDELCGSDDAFYTVTVQLGLTYTFTLCDTTCPGAGATFDSGLELYDTTGALVASSADACGGDAEIVHTAPTVGGAGAWCLRVIREAGSEADFTLGWKVSCEPPVPPTMGPDSGSTSAEDCGNDVTFVASTGGTGAFTWDWSIVPLTGDSATPSTHTEDTNGPTSRFPTTLSGDGTFEVTVTVTNDCGSETSVLIYSLEDRRGPDLDCSAEPCAEPVRPAPATTTGPTVRAMAQPSSKPEIWNAPREIDLAAVKESMLDSADPGQARALLAAKLGISPDRIVVRDGREPSLRRPPLAAALGCGAPCTSGTLGETHPFYDVYLSCSDGSFTARTGVSHSVTIGSGQAQNVIFGGRTMSPGTSDVTWYVHDNDTTYTDPAGGSACSFDPPDTAAEADSIGLEMEWPNMSPLPGANLTLREEIVAFGDIEANSGVRLTLGVTNEISSTETVTMGVRWQIDYQNSGDDGPLYARVRCDPFEVFDERSTEHEFDPLTEIDDFYRIQNNTAPPIFANFTSTAPIAGFLDTDTPDRLIYGRWGSLLNSAWDYVAAEGAAGPDGDSATLVYYGYQVVDGITIDPGETFSRSVVIFTQGEDQDCGAFVPGEGVNADTQICPGECASIGAEAADNCSTATVVLVESSAGAPPCVGNPCLVDFPDEGVYNYTWEATDEQGNSTLCTSTIRVVDDGTCNQPPSCQAGPDVASDCRDAGVDGATAEDPDNDELTWEWTSSDPNVVLSPAGGVLPAGPGDRPIPPVAATLDPSVAPCGVVATLTLTVTDPSGEISTCERTVSFNDTEPPTVMAPEGPSACIWPPNHSYVCIDLASLDVTVSDSCTEATWRLSGCVSDQPDEAPEDDSDFNGDGNFEDDCVVSPDGAMICVRAERAGSGADAQAGRTYTLLAIATDECGNESEPLPAVTVHVPHDQSPAEPRSPSETDVGLARSPEARGPRSPPRVHEETPGTSSPLPARWSAQKRHPVHFRRSLVCLGTAQSREVGKRHPVHFPRSPGRRSRAPRRRQPGKDTRYIFGVP